MEAAPTPSGRGLRFGLWGLGALVGLSLLDLGVVAFLLGGVNDGDIDGPFTTRSRIVWGGFGILVALMGLALLVVSIVRATRVLRRRTRETLAGGS